MSSFGAKILSPKKLQTQIVITEKLRKNFCMKKLVVNVYNIVTWNSSAWRGAHRERCNPFQSFPLSSLLGSPRPKVRPWANIIKLFFSVTDTVQNKLNC
jgi:hypothetical protein